MIKCEGHEVHIAGNERRIVNEAVMVLLAVQHMLSKEHGDRYAEVMVRALFQAAMDDRIQRAAKDVRATHMKVDSDELLKQMREMDT